MNTIFANFIATNSKDAVIHELTDLAIRTGSPRNAFTASGGILKFWLKMALFNQHNLMVNDNDQIIKDLIDHYNIDPNWIQPLALYQEALANLIQAKRAICVFNDQWRDSIHKLINVIDKLDLATPTDVLAMDVPQLTELLSELLK